MLVTISWELVLGALALVAAALGVTYAYARWRTLAAERDHVRWVLGRAVSGNIESLLFGKRDPQGHLFDQQVVDQLKLLLEIERAREASVSRHELAVIENQLQEIRRDIMDAYEERESVRAELAVAHAQLEAMRSYSSPVQEMGIESADRAAEPDEPSSDTEDPPHEVYSYARMLAPSADYRVAYSHGLEHSSDSARTMENLVGAAYSRARFRAATAELVQVLIFKAGEASNAARLARQSNAGARQAGPGAALGLIARDSPIHVQIKAWGGHVDVSHQTQTWRGAILQYAFLVTPEAGVREVKVRLTVSIGQAEIGYIHFVRPVTGKVLVSADAAQRREKLKRYRRVFLSYSSKDREQIASIAMAYRVAGVSHFWDRTSLESGEVWAPRLMREINRSDLFHLCWSQAASKSEWVEKEAHHAITRQSKSWRRRPAIKVQMLDGPPWAPHPKRLDSINFDDFVRAAAAGYAQGDRVKPSTARPSTE